MPAITISTLFTITNLKIALFIFIAIFILLLFKKPKAKWFVLLFTIFLSVSYGLLILNQKKLFWGNQGDEIFIISFFCRVINGQYFSDFFYGWLPPFYPPLYFWIVGTISKLVTHNGINAAQIGVFLTLTAWFPLPYLWQKFYFRKNLDEKSTLVSNWLWLLFPLLFFLMIDFDAIILKPYEVFPALFGIIFITLFGHSLNNTYWNWKRYLFFGASGGLLFLIYHFWWLIYIPTLFFIVLTSKERLRNLKRLIVTGFIIFAVSAIYLVPLSISYLKNGVENWQIKFGIAADFATFLPWSNLSLRGILYILGLIGLIYLGWKNFHRPSLIIFITCFIYQIVNFIIFLFTKQTYLAAKPFLFLSTAALAYGGANFLIFSYQKLSIKITAEKLRLVNLIVFIIFLPLWPNAHFFDNPTIQKQIQKNSETPGVKFLTDKIISLVPDYQKRTWLTSGFPELNAYLPINHFIGYNAHFNHPAAKFEKRFSYLREITEAKSSVEFMNLINNSQPPIDTLLFFKNKNSNDNYPLFFLRDNYPNAGREEILYLPKYLITSDHWQIIYDNPEIIIYIKK